MAATAVMRFFYRPLVVKHRGGYHGDVREPSGSLHCVKDDWEIPKCLVLGTRMDDFPINVIIQSCHPN
jgi:hypothetical protein